MSCSPNDVRDYFFRELPEPESGRVAAHLEKCPACREEMDRLRATQAALLVLREEEIPRRIAFVSDKIFEPSALRRAWQAVLGPPGRLNFAAAALLSVALLVSAFYRPATVAPAPAPQVDLARLEADFQKRVDAAVSKAVAESEARQAEKTAAVLAAAERRFELDRKNLELTAESSLDYMRKKLNVMYLASAAERGGETK